MTQTANLFLLEFQCLCADYCIDPAVAIEIPAVQLAIRARDLEAVREALQNET